LISYSSFIKETEKLVNSRIAGSNDESVFAEYLESILFKSTDKVERQFFTFPFLYNQYELNFLCIMYCLALMGYILFPILGVVFLILTGLYHIIVNFYDFLPLKFLLSKNKSQNIISEINPQKEVQQTLIFTSHLDSPYTNGLLEDPYRKHFRKMRIAFNACFIVLFIFSAMRSTGFLSIVTEYLSLIPFIGLAYIMFYQNKTVTYSYSSGVNNSLTSIGVILNLADHFYLSRLKHTKLMFCIFGAKEQKTRGSNQFIKENLKDLNNVKVINLEGLSGDELKLINNEYLINHDKKLINQVSDICKKAEIRFTVGTPLNYTDAFSFSLEKIPAITILSQDKKGITFSYGLKKDSIEKMSEPNLNKVYNMCKEIAQLTDEKKF
jgi:hypothetical protein